MAGDQFGKHTFSRENQISYLFSHMFLFCSHQNPLPAICFPLPSEFNRNPKHNLFLSMPSIVGRNTSPFKETVAVKSEKANDFALSKSEATTPQKRKLRSFVAALQDGPMASLVKRTSPRRAFNSSPNRPEIESEKDSSVEAEKTSTSPVKISSDILINKPNWSPRDAGQISAVKEALHVSTAQAIVVCREDEQKRIFEFCKACIEEEKAGSLYVCGCPGTGKSLSMEKVKQNLIDWVKQEGLNAPDVLSINCTSLINTSEIFNKIIGKSLLRKRTNMPISPLQYLQNFYSQQSSPDSKMKLIIADELDYLITKDRAVLHDLFMLTTFPSSRCILIGIANAIDLADRFLPRLQSLNCKPMVITFRAYSKDQILRILHERLLALPWTIFHPLALELCARKVAAASGDMRKALCVCRSAIEILEAELNESESNMNFDAVEKELCSQQTAPARQSLEEQQYKMVRIDHMASALSKAYRSPVVDIIQSLPQHQQIILCAAVKFFRGGKKDTTVGELNKQYINICKSTMIPPAGILEVLSMCRVLNDQGLLKLGQSRDDKMRRLTLNVDAADVNFALQGFRFFRNCLL
ncbi:cell division control protein 6 homolog B-like [Euphorbia lathyris]|uniref:cell division control protein 6 homolog B-like n=1 Tax=Euphorbia lathyris TaxID=212925 RepID=UPI00331398C2